jgi:8-oxo-dGTP diphosphatase
MNPKIIAAGGLVVRQNGGRWEALLVGSGDPIIWRIPKGIQETGETRSQTACREVEEETGFCAVVIDLIGTAAWTYEYQGQNWDKTTHFFLMRLTLEEPRPHDAEHDHVRWMILTEAISALFYECEQKIARDAKLRVEAADFDPSLLLGSG